HGIVKPGVEFDPEADDDNASQHSYGPGSLPEPSKEDQEGGDEEDKPTSRNPLKLYTVDLCERARRGKIDPLIGREREIERTVQVLCRRRKNNPLYVGDAGVGKTALAEGLALKIVQREVPAAL